MMKWLHGESMAPYRRRSFISAVAASLLAGCAATAQVGLEPGLAGRLRDMGEIRAIHYRAAWRDRIPPTAMRVLGRSGMETGKFVPIEAPVGRVKNVFLRSVSEQLGLTNIRIIDQPYGVARIGPLMAPPIDVLKSELGTGMVFDFYTGVWELGEVYRPLAFDAPRYHFNTLVRGRLIRLDDSTILWQQICLPQGLKLEQRTLDEWQANDAALLKTEVERQSQACAADLVRRFIDTSRPR